MGINVKQYEGHDVYPRDDAVLYDSIINQSGIIKGCEVTHLGANLLSVASGYGVIKGRLFEITEQTIYARLSENGTIQGRIKIRMELSNADLPIQIATESADKLPDLEQDEECNYNGGNYEIELAQYSINEIAISGLEATAPQVDVLRDLKDLTLSFNSHAHDDRYFTEAEVTNLLKSKQDAATAINTSNISQQSVNYATSAGSAVDQTARNNANAALEKNVEALTYSSGDIFTTFGVQRITRAGKMAFIHMHYKLNYPIGANSVIATIPYGFRPYVDFGGISPANILAGSKGTITIGSNGAIQSSSAFSQGDYVLDFAYPIA